MPDVTKLPIVLSGDLIFKNSLLMYAGSPLRNYGEIPLLLPSGQIDSLLSPKVNIALKPGINPNYPLRPQTLLSNYSLEPLVKAKKSFQEQAEILSENMDMLLQILHSYLIKYSQRRVQPRQMVRVTAEEFFSLDGMYPSAIGQAMIANEVIKTINKAYNMDIPLISIREIKD